ncbi:MAG: DUF4294 domain-containing protein [Chitinophagaceae bacterium]|nr:DUF4294 domain-containing protein [Chitinophagaceae bacterium]
MKLGSFNNCLKSLLFLFILMMNKEGKSQAIGVHDTLLMAAVVYNGDTIEAKTLAGVYVYAYTSAMSANARWTRLRNAVYVTYPYAKKAAVVLNDINRHIAGSKDQQFRRNYINSREKELKKEFTDPLTNLSVYQGKVLMKLINRETGNNVYDILKDYKGGLDARLWQTIAFFFGSNLKQPYDPKGEDAEMETIVKEVRRMYGYNS